MKLSTAILAASLGSAFAHNDHGQHVPKLVGARKFLSGLDATRRAVPREQGAARRQHLSANSGESSRERRDVSADGKCGANVGTCASGQCCSAEGCVVLLECFTSSER